MEDFLMAFEVAFLSAFRHQPQNFQEKEFVSVGTKLESFLFMNNPKLKELFALFAADNQVLFGCPFGLVVDSLYLVLRSFCNFAYFHQNGVDCLIVDLIGSLCGCGLGRLDWSG